MANKSGIKRTNLTTLTINHGEDNNNRKLFADPKQAMSHSYLFATFG